MGRHWSGMPLHASWSCEAVSTRTWCFIGPPCALRLAAGLFPLLFILSNHVDSNNQSFITHLPSAAAAAAPALAPSDALMTDV